MADHDDPNRTFGKIALSVKLVKDPFTIGAARWRAHVAQIIGYGKTITAAKQDVCRKVEQALDRLDTDPAFARDDDGSLIVAVQQTHGVIHWKVTPDGQVRSITATDGPPRRSLEGVWHYEVLGS